MQPVAQVLCFDRRLRLALCVHAESVACKATLGYDPESTFRQTHQSNSVWFPNWLVVTQWSFSGPKLTLTSVNIEGISSVKEDLLQEFCKKYKCDLLCLQETHRGENQWCPSVPGSDWSLKDHTSCFPGQRPTSFMTNPALITRGFFFTVFGFLFWGEGTRH